MNVIQLNDSDSKPSKRIDEGRPPITGPAQQIKPNDDKGRPPIKKPADRRTPKGDKK